jgi:uncharacterized protein
MRSPGVDMPAPEPLPSETMLPLDLVRLSREGSLRVQGEIPADSPLWEGTGIRLQGPLRVDLKAAEARSSGELVVRGWVEGTLDQQCRRCVEPVAVPLREEMTFVYAPPDLLEGDEDGDIRVLSTEAQELDLAEAIREEVVLAATQYVLCKPDCRGLCPQCGTDLNESTCECVVEDPDPRWDTLRALKNE